MDAVPWPVVAGLGLVGGVVLVAGLAGFPCPDVVVIDPAAPTIRFLQPGQGSWFGPRVRREVPRAAVRGVRVLSYRDEPGRRATEDPDPSLGDGQPGQPGADLTHDLRAATGAERVAVVLDVAGRRFPMLLWPGVPEDLHAQRALAKRVGDLLDLVPTETDLLTPSAT